MALEDAAVLGNVLSHISQISHLPYLLRAYERLRYDRASATQASSRLNQHIFHLPDGPEQEKRDAGRAVRAARPWAWAFLSPASAHDHSGGAGGGDLGVLLGRAARGPDRADELSALRVDGNVGELLEGALRAAS